MQDTGSFHTGIHICRADPNDSSVHTPVACETTKGILINQPCMGQPKVKHPVTARLVPWKRLHEVAAQWEGLISHKNIWLSSYMLSPWQQSIWWQAKGPIQQLLAKVGVCQDTAVTGPPIAAHIHHSKAVL